LYASYVGTHGMAHHLETVLDAARELTDRKDIAFLLVGDGAERSRLVAMRDQMALPNVIMLGQEPKGKMPHLWALSDASLGLLKKSKLFTAVIPSRIFESMAMEKPVILGLEGETAVILKTADAGFCIEPENSYELAERVLELYRNRDLAAKLGSSGRRHVAEHYDRTVLARRYEYLLAALILSSKSAASPLVDRDQSSR
jgi:glycosyltransferase involved in cell wall biosynthesis